MMEALALGLIRPRACRARMCLQTACWIVESGHVQSTLCLNWQTE